jgi:GNAT superfamily N-acetyltransferase
MQIQIRRAEHQDVESMRGLYRQEMSCQIIYDSFFSRGLADCYLILVEGSIGGYGAISNKYDKGRLVEFYTLSQVRRFALPMFRELLAASRATSIAAQTNIPLMLMMLYDCAKNITTEKILFHDAFITRLDCRNGVFRHSNPEEAGTIFPHSQEPVGDWVIEANGAIVATGGFLCHYNPPYGDIYMEVAETARLQGYGSYLVQELKRVCYEAGKKPAARCSPDNAGSRRTLEKAGLLPCGRLLVGKVK